VGMTQEKNLISMFIHSGFMTIKSDKRNVLDHFFTLILGFLKNHFLLNHPGSRTFLGRPDFTFNFVLQVFGVGSRFSVSILVSIFECHFLLN
jgi:hypothetical protein